MDRQQIQVFIDSAVRYFNHLPHSHVDVGTPFLVDNAEPVAFDLTGIIHISGPSEGCVYFSARRPLLDKVLDQLGETDHDEANLRDIAGELANTLSGNARAEFGRSFEISVPLIVDGAPNMLHLPPDLRSYVIPINWDGSEAAIGICVEETSASVPQT